MPTRNESSTFWSDRTDIRCPLPTKGGSAEGAMPLTRSFLVRYFSVEMAPCFWCIQRVIAA